MKRWIKKKNELDKIIKSMQDDELHLYPLTVGRNEGIQSV